MASFANHMEVVTWRNVAVRFFRHLTAAFACLTGVLVVFEWLMPGFVLPYLPIWPFAVCLGFLLLIAPER